MSLVNWLPGALKPLLLPPANLLLLLAAGFLLSRWHKNSGRLLTAFAFVLLVFFCTPFGANFLVRPLEEMCKPLADDDRSKALAIVVLAAGKLEKAPEYGNSDIPDYIALARLRYAAKLQHETQLPLLVSGGNVPADEPGNSKAKAMATALKEDFLTPVEWIEGQSETTEENAFFSARMLQEKNITRILLVTDAMHMRRAHMVFERAGLQVIDAPTMFFSQHGHEAQVFIPSAEGLRRTYYATYEWLGLLWYSYVLNHSAAT